MKKILEYIFLILAIIAFSLICIVEYNKRHIHTCEITHDASTTTLPCEYLDGIVKIKL